MTGRLESVDRIVEVLDYLVTHQSDVGISELSRGLGYSKSVIHRTLSSLCAHGYLSANPVTRRYRLGYRALSLGLAALTRLDLRRLAVPRLERLQAATDETVNVGLLVGNRRVYVERIESSQAPVQRVELGHEFVLYRGAGGKAMLAFLPAEHQACIFDEALAAGERLDALRAHLARIQVMGYALTHGERRPGSFSVAAPIFDHRGAVVGSLGLAGPQARWREECEPRYSALVLKEARELSRELGYAPDLMPPLAAGAREAGWEPAGATAAVPVVLASGPAAT